MIDEYKIDNHKLNYHPCRVCDWLSGCHIFPIYIEISPCNHCNHRCSFCSFNFTGYDPISLDTKVLETNILLMAINGVKSIMYAGEGEPLLHKDIISIINHTKSVGIDVSITTNGVLMNKKFVEGCLKDISWIKISIESSNPETYSKLHGTNKKDLKTIYDNLRYAVKYKKDNKLDCTIGTQAVLLEDNKEDLDNLVKDMRSIGVDYIVIKPYTNHPYREEKDDIYYDDALDELSKYSTNHFNVIIRKDTFRELESERVYDECYSLDFWAYIDSKGDVYSCSNFLSNKDYAYGNIYEKEFDEIWRNKINPDIPLKQCRNICRMDKINRYLWELKHPNKHVNFI